MAKFYGKFKEILLNCQNEIKVLLTKRNSNEILYLIRGEFESIPLWHFILIPFEEICQTETKKMIDWNLFAREIQYLNKRNEICSLSGWGIHPSIDLQFSITKFYSNQITRNSFQREFFHKTLFEDLSNELFYEIFDYLTFQQISQTFFHLNSRFNHLIFSLSNQTLILNGNKDFHLLKLFPNQISHLIIKNLFHFETNFNIKSLIIENEKNFHEKFYEIFPNLQNLKLQCEINRKCSRKFLNEIFSSKSVHLRHLTLNRIETFSIKHSFLSIEYLSIRSHNLMLFSQILSLFPNLNHLQFHILDHFLPYLPISPSNSTYFLPRLTLFSDLQILSTDVIFSFLHFLPNLRRFYLQTNCQSSFLQFIQHLPTKLPNLSYFSCYFKENLDKSQRIGDLHEIHQISSCFQRIRCFDENEHYRIFFTN
ncbi:unnamed protein product [Adineta ricciae]|uniref:F-box domain-containing protein n=1 Tax=Adineta ricciae TaxID=249248 RepID=A0A815YDS9_ADIRI|nr:unnamed protein product [Adineta ricciae]CAF1569437.1 unnamed protein product [Adineta ricciae]